MSTTASGKTPEDKLYDELWIDNQTLHELVKQLKAENERLREALKEIAYWKTKEYEIMTVPHVIIANIKKYAREALAGDE